ncbi:MAG TPA: hypothetical protein VNX68_10620 [Nitrosopumilaceae archaeon]|nr:hypothetical protein [Nitrosopumilaceae archaeon]
MNLITEQPVRVIKFGEEYWGFDGDEMMSFAHGERLKGFAQRVKKVGGKIVTAEQNLVAKVKTLEANFKAKRAARKLARKNNKFIDTVPPVNADGTKTLPDGTTQTVLPTDIASVKTPAGKVIKYDKNDSPDAPPLTTPTGALEQVVPDSSVVALTAPDGSQSHYKESDVEPTGMSPTKKYLIIGGSVLGALVLSALLYRHFKKKGK